MATYLKITNRGTVDRRMLELIGFSLKRDGSAARPVIGFKGSGAKLAPIAALRLGLDVQIASSDAGGRYRLAFGIEDEMVGGRSEKSLVMFIHRPGQPPEKRPLPFTLDAFADWDLPVGADDNRCYKVVREFICNAYDADERFRTETADAPDFAAAGETSVYVVLTPEVEAVAWNESDRYLKFIVPAQPLFRIPGVGAVYPKSDADRCRMFVLGTLAGCQAKPRGLTALFDYSLDNKDMLSEERLLKSEYGFISGLARLFQRLTDVELATEVLEASGTSSRSVERSAVDGMVPLKDAAARDCWLAAAKRTFGQTVAVGSCDHLINADARLMGYQPVETPYSALGRLLIDLGLPKADDVAGKGPVRREEVRTVPFDRLDSGSQCSFLRAFRLLAACFPHRATYPVRFVEILSPRLARARGMTFRLGQLTDRNSRREIWIAVMHGKRLPSMIDIFKTLLHESRHLSTSADDGTREIENAGDDDSGVLAEILNRGERPVTEASPILPDPTDDPFN